MSKILKDEPRVDNYYGYQARSLNIEKRRRELIKITQENHAMLQRIMARKPAYPRQHWKEFWVVSSQSTPFKKSFMNAITRNEEY